MKIHIFTKQREKTNIYLYSYTKIMILKYIKNQEPISEPASEKLGPIREPIREPFRIFSNFQKFISTYKIKKLLKINQQQKNNKIYMFIIKNISSNYF